MFFFQCIAVGAAIGVVAGLCEIVWGLFNDEEDEDAEDLKSSAPRSA